MQLKGLSSTVIQLNTTNTRASQLFKDRNLRLTFTHSQLTKWDPGIRIRCAAVLRDWMEQAQTQAVPAYSGPVTGPSNLQDLPEVR